MDSVAIMPGPCPSAWWPWRGHITVTEMVWTTDGTSHWRTRCIDCGSETIE